MKNIILSCLVSGRLADWTVFDFCGEGMSWTWTEWKCLTADENLVIPEVLVRKGRHYKDETYYQYKVYDATTDGCGKGHYWDTQSEACKDIDECEVGIDNCKIYNKNCHNLVGSYKCVCRIGYESAIPANINDRDVILESDLETCQDINECESQCNQKGQHCINTDGSFVCECQDGFQLNAYGGCSDVNECAEKPCGENAVCRNLNGSYECACFKDYYRDPHGTCIQADVCATKGSICQWKCVNYGESFNCICPVGFVLNGNMCSDINECNANPCQHGEVCLNNHGSVTCEKKTKCPPGFSPIQGWKNEFERTKQDTNICHKDYLAENTCGKYCQYDSILNHYADLLNDSKRGTKLFKFYRNARYGYSADYGFTILSIIDGEGRDVKDQNEFKIKPKYRNRPMAYLRSQQPIKYNKSGNSLRHLTVEYYAKDRELGDVLYKELIIVHVFISEYNF